LCLQSTDNNEDNRQQSYSIETSVSTDRQQ
jgi:hypothetical protein